MASRKENSNRNETFGRLLSGAIKSIAAYEGKTEPIIEDELGNQMHLAGKTIQRYKAGHLPPEDHAVEVLAEAAIKRGYLGREWLQRFLRAARYPFAEKLLDQLCPIGPVRPHPPRVYENLPAPTYSQFVMREQAFAEVVDGLQQRSAVVLIVGLGGNGKTSLAREVAAQCLQNSGNGPRFDAVVWVSDKDRPGTTNLSVVLDEIARTLDYPGFTQFAHDEKLYEVGQLLKRQRVLVVVDNFETITDGALLSWLLRLPEPSKALITSREYGREYRRGGWPVELRGMSEAEARELVGQRLRVLRITQLVGDPTQLEPLLIATGGNPKAIEIALGLVKHERRPFQHVVDDLYAARGELFDDLFTRAWALLDEAARRVLLVMTFFPASTSGEALSATADVQGFAFDRAVERLADLALLDVQQADLNSTPRYTMHPLVRAFAGTRPKEVAGFEEGSRKRWVEWYVQLASKVGYCWNDVERLKILDPEKDNIYIVINWCFQNYLYQDTIKLVRGVEYYYYVRGLWSKQPSIYLMAAEAAREQNNHLEELWQLARHVEALSIQGDLAEIRSGLERLSVLEQSTALPVNVLYMYKHVVALVALANCDFDTAQQTREKTLKMVTQVSEQASISNKHWLATCLYRKGLLNEAEKLFREALSEAIYYGYQRSIIFCQFNLAAIELDQKNFERAEALLEASSQKANEYQDRRYIAEIGLLSARLHTLRGDLPAAHAALAEAIDLFERLGMRRELTEAREALADLDARELAETAR